MFSKQENKILCQRREEQKEKKEKREREGGPDGGGGRRCWRRRGEGNTETKRVMKTHISVLNNPYPQPDSHSSLAHGTGELYQRCAGTGMNRGKSLLAKHRKGKTATGVQTICNRIKEPAGLLP